MRRVVRPGGRVVVAEPDWASIVVDSSDPDGVALLIRQANTLRRQPFIGRELNRRLAAVGLTDRRIEAIPIFSLDYGELVTYGLGLPQAADTLAAEGRLDRERSRAIINALIDGSRRIRNPRQQRGAHTSLRSIGQLAAGIDLGKPTQDKESPI